MHASLFVLATLTKVPTVYYIIFSLFDRDKCQQKEQIERQTPAYRRSAKYLPLANEGV